MEFNPEDEVNKMTPQEQQVVMQFIMKLQGAFNIKNIDILKDSKSEACKEIYNLYEQLKNEFN